MVSEKVCSPSKQGFEGCCGFKHFHQSPTSFWYYQNTFVGTYTVRITVGPHALHGLFFLPSDLHSPLKGEPYMDSLHPYMDSLHLYMDPLYPLVCNIFNKFAGCPCCPQRFHNLYNNPCCSTNSWHPLWPSTLNQTKRGVVASTQHFIGSSISHCKYLFKIANRYFTKSHFTSYFERYHRLNLSMYLTQ
jgi:hypothetical protein